MLQPITAPTLAALSGIRHAFFTREGGVSQGIYAGLNCGTGSSDDRASVLENRARAAATLGQPPEKLATPHQVHGTDVIEVTEAWLPGEGPRADAVVTRTPGIVIGVGSADCGPLLFADAEAGVVGAAHAGWRGAIAGVSDTTIAAMERLGACRENIMAVLGPTISQKNYEVGPEVRDQFLAQDAAHARFFVPSINEGKFMLDLPRYIVARLDAAGVNGSALHHCTYADPALFFSFRRATHTGEEDYGRLLSAITIG